MVEKGHMINNQLKNEVIYPELLGGKAYRFLLIGWGSTRNIVGSFEANKRAEIRILHFKQVYPYQGNHGISCQCPKSNSNRK